ncbi:MAG: Ig-like domain-containing protein [Verrucomicrobiota bacterium]
MEARRTKRIHGIGLPFHAGTWRVRIALLLVLLVGRWVNAASPGEVVAWGASSDGQTSVPLGARSGVVAVAAGFSHTVALRSEGGVVAWGGNGSGQTDVPAAAKTGIIAVAAGSDYTLALTSKGAVVAWGDSSSLQTDVPLSAQNGVVRIAAGAFHSLALSGDGSIITWGDNSFGQRDGPAAARTRVIAIAAGYGHTVALKDGGEVVAWGDNRRGQTNVPVNARTGVTAIAAGTGHNIALKDDGTVIAWGDDREGQSTVPAEASTGVVAVAAGATHSMALRADGSVIVWGSNTSGQRIAPSAASSGITGIAAGWSYSVAVEGIPSPPVIRFQPSARSVALGQMSGFTVIAEGFPVRYQWRRDGQDVLGATVPVYHPGPAQTYLAGGYSVVVSNLWGSVTSAPPAMLSVEPGAVVEWGDDLAGQTNVPPAAMTGVKAMAVGFGHTLALKNDGSVLAWGDDRQGQTNTPIGARTGVKAVAAGNGHSVALRTDGSVVAWGDNGYGQVAVLRAARTDVVAIAAGTFHTVALKSDGSVIAWGAGASATSTDPELGQSIVPVTAQSGVMAIAAGDLHTLALRSDGSVLAWGWDEYGQSKVPDAAKSNVVAIAAGGFHSMALKTDGSLVAWGLGALGQTTVPAGAMSDIVAIAAGKSHSVALRSDGSLVTWGSDIYGERKVPASLPPAVAIAAGGFLSAALVAPVAVEDTAPTVGAVPDQTVPEDSGPLVLSFRVADAETTPEALVGGATADDAALFPAAGIRIGGDGGQRTLTLEPAADRSGGTEVAIVVRDAAGLSTTNRFRVSVISVNDVPTIDPVDEVLLPEDAPARTILLSGITSGSSSEAQKLSVNAVSDNPSLLPDPIVEYTSPGTTGRLVLRPAQDANGTVTVTVTVKDDGGTASGEQDTFSRRFKVTVAPVDDPPTVVLVSPPDGLSSAEGKPIRLSATASDIDVVVAKVEFFEGVVR